MQLIGVIAVGLWMLTAAFHVDIARRVLKVPRAEPNELLTVDQFVSQALNSATDEADSLKNELGQVKFTYWSLTATAAALLFALIWPPPPAAKPDSTLS